MTTGTSGGNYRLEHGAYLRLIVEDAAELATATEGLGTVKVPSCPEWTVTDLLEHVGGCYRFWAMNVRAANPDAVTEFEFSSSAGDGDPGKWMEEQAADLVAAIEAVEPETGVWNWSLSDHTAAWVARRMALETAIHKYDGELAAGSPKAIACDLAVDGIDERIYVHLAADIPEEPEASLGGSLCLVCDDAEAAWTVEAAAGLLKARNYQGPASACLTGTASNLFLFSWNRLSISALSLTGDPAVATAWSSLPV